MKVLVIYDISNDRSREELANHLQRLGLCRIQRSVFLGRANSRLLKELERVTSRYLNPRTDVIHIVPIDELYWRRVKVLGTPYYARNSLGGVLSIA